jgi:hypothetical protein
LIQPKLEPSPGVEVNTFAWYLGDTITLEFPRESTTTLSSYFRRKARSFSKGDRRQEQTAVTQASEIAKLVLFIKVTKWLNLTYRSGDDRSQIKKYKLSS